MIYYQQFSCLDCLLLTPAEYGKGLDPIMTLSEYLVASKGKHFDSTYLPRAEITYANGTPIIFRFESVKQINLWLIKKLDRDAESKFTSFGQLKNQTAILRLIPEDGIFKSISEKFTFKNELDLIKAFNNKKKNFHIASHYVSSEKESCTSTTEKQSKSFYSEEVAAINVPVASNDPLDNEQDQYQDGHSGTSGSPMLADDIVVESSDEESDLSDHAAVVDIETVGQTDKDTQVSDDSDTERGEIIQTEAVVGQPTEHTKYENLQSLVDEHSERTLNRHYVDQGMESLKPNANGIKMFNFDISDEKDQAKHELESGLSEHGDMHQLQMPKCKQDQEDLHSVAQMIESLNVRDSELFDHLHLKNKDQEDHLNASVELIGIKDQQVLQSVDQMIKTLKARDTEPFPHSHVKDRDQEDHLNYLVEPVDIQDQEDLQPFDKMIESPKAPDAELFDHLYIKDQTQKNHPNDLVEPLGIEDQQELPPVDQIIESLKARDIELFDHFYVKNQENHDNDHVEIPVNQMPPADPLKKEDTFAGYTVISDQVNVKDMDQGDGQDTVNMDQILSGDNSIRN